MYKRKYNLVFLAVSNEKHKHQAGNFIDLKWKNFERMIWRFVGYHNCNIERVHQMLNYVHSWLRVIHWATRGTERDNQIVRTCCDHKRWIRRVILRIDGIWKFGATVRPLRIYPPTIAEAHTWTYVLFVTDQNIQYHEKLIQITVDVSMDIL